MRDWKSSIDFKRCLDSANALEIARPLKRLIDSPAEVKTVIIVVERPSRGADRGSINRECESYLRVALKSERDGYCLVVRDAKRGLERIVTFGNRPSHARIAD